jgi:predicted DNA-binding protein (MmcQ/YjbR family)
MNLDELRRYCATLPGATRDIKWGADEVYSVGSKMFAVFWIDNGKARTVSFKSDPARFLELTDRPGIVPAPYLARAYWVQIKEPASVPDREAKDLVRDSHERVLRGLTKKAQAAIVGSEAIVPPAARDRNPTRRPAR